MQVKLLRQAAGRDDRIVAVYEDVTFLNEHVGWYLIIKDRFCEEDDIVVVVLLSLIHISMCIRDRSIAFRGLRRYNSRATGVCCCFRTVASTNSAPRAYRKRCGNSRFCTVHLCRNDSRGQMSQPK